MAILEVGVAKIKEILGTKMKEADMEVEEDKEVMVEEVKKMFLF